MSKILLDKIWETKDMIPYLESFFSFHKAKKMYLLGSRGKTPYENWDKLKGKDWDILIEFDKEVSWPNQLVHKKYHLDILYMGNKKQINIVRNIGYNGCKGGYEIFPNTPDFLKEFLINKTK
jgi:hypothetical protein